REEIVEVLREAMGMADVVLVTGGLGATPDDLTREAAALAFGRRLVLNEEYRESLKEKFREWGLDFTREEERQAFLPEGAVPLPNPIGICGFRMEAEGKVAFFFPGVPRELREMVKGSLVPFLQERAEGASFSKLFKVFGPTESGVKELLEGFEGDFTLAFLPSFPEIHLRLTLRGRDREELLKEMEGLEEELRGRLGLHLFGTEDDTMEKVVGELLRERGATIATAESCTGGLVAHRITEVPGSSDYFEGGVVSYSNRAKVELLGVPEEILGRHGAVSEETARLMAQGIRERRRTTFGLSTTGIAGPTGGTPEAPVGRIFIALATKDHVEVRRYDLFGDRGQIKLLASEIALDRVRRFLLRNPDFRP
ncbi:MAG: competence/damage-inducible protein A, partial [Deltaproteobacteria bacterium]